MSDPLERVRTLGLSYFGFAQQHPEAFRTMFELAQCGSAGELRSDQGTENCASIV